MSQANEVKAAAVRPTSEVVRYFRKSLKKWGGRETDSAANQEGGVT